MFTKLIIIYFALLALPIVAQNPFNGLRVGGHASTTGIGAELSYQFNSSPWSSWRIRGAYTYVGFNKAQQFGMDKGKSIDLSPNLQKKVAQLSLDYFPFKRKRWHLSTGFAYNVDQTYRFEVSTETGVSLGGIDIEANDFGTIRGGVKWNTWMPYLGFGYLANLYREKVWLNIDLGTYYMGSPKLDISYDGFLETTTLDEEIPKIEHNLRNYSYYPYLSLGLGWKF
jgi:hypothetical protein